MTPPGGTSPTADPLGLVVALTRVEVKLDNLTDDVRDHGKDITALKDRRWPMNGVTLVISAAGVILGAWALLTGR